MWVSYINMSEIIKLTTISTQGITNAGETISFTAPFENIPAGRDHTFATEIVKIISIMSTDAVAAALIRGTDVVVNTGPDSGVGFINPNYIWAWGAGAGNPTVVSQSTQVIDYTDGNGNGFIVPENEITFSWFDQSDAGAVCSLMIFYRMRKIRNVELLTLMINQGSANN
jgi:hypothetical protein